MWPFTQRKSLKETIEEMKQVNTPAMEKWKRKEAERDEFVRDRLPQMIADIREADLKNALATATEWESDKALYFLKAVRHGDFLALFITRQTKPDDIGRMVTSVNLSRVKRVDLVPGHEPDTKGEGWFHFYGSRPSFSEPATAYPFVPFDEFSGRRLIESGDVGEMRTTDFTMMRHALSGYGNPDPSIKETVKGLARHASSDRIHFVGSDVTIPVPFGLGKQVYSTIMDEVQRGYLPPTAALPGGASQ